MRRVVQLRASGGAGKTTTVRAILNDPRGRWEEDWGPVLFPEQIKERKKPIVLGYYAAAWNLYVVGSYHIACGGAEGLPMVEIVGRVRQQVNRGMSVLFEGLFCSNSVGHFHTLDLDLKAMVPPVEYVAAFLSTPLDVCLARIQQRRTEKGNPRILDPRVQTQSWHRMRSAERSLRARGVRTEWLPFNEEERVVRELLELPLT